MTMQTPQPAKRRRLYLMRHGSVDYFLPDGTPLPPRGVPLNAAGRAQADAAGALFAAAEVEPDVVLVSGLPRTVETATRVLAAAGLERRIERDPEFEEIRSGRLADIEAEQLQPAFLGAFQAAPGVSISALEPQRFLGGESVGELLDRVLPALQRFLEREDWQCALLVLHGGVNRALLSSLLAGGRAFFGAIEQAPGCINVLDMGSGDPPTAVLRGLNLAPTQWLQQREYHTTMEKLLTQYLRRPRPNA
ncbi:MAG: hypothetical protein RJA44_1704 [Pseudomonadota bacterium]|jgi:probable phosphoglycerate mutase